MLLTLPSTPMFALSFNNTRSSGKVDPAAIATFALTGAALASAPAGVLVESLPHIAHLETLTAGVELEVFPTAINFQTECYLLPRIGATNYAINAYINPIVAISRGARILSEQLTPIQMAGMGLISIEPIVTDGLLVRCSCSAPA